MPADLRPDPRYFNIGEKKTVTSDDLQQVTIGENETTIFSKMVPGDKVAWFGHGQEDREYAKAFIYADLVASGNGTGTAGDAIEGELVAVYTDSEQRHVLASTTVDSLGELSDAKADTRTDRPVFEAHGEHANPERHLEFRILPNSASTGMEIDPSASEARLYYSQS
ncbi:hypothetical protein [Halobacterium litoreum]|uniref:Uncharacterized protein n=1 Tax=Halobacterium litoreum TaxID=2039234 RepID=A0ABD5NA72_9EURY|nr:hypothetical protein [Halobacterium litoreum]UHH14867.1 hypothetical protein LT972_14770 [Halobacterium litoreum]